MNKYKEFLNKEIIAVYKVSNIGINFSIRGILIAAVNEEIVIRSTSEVGKGTTKVIKYEDLVKVEKFKI